MAGGGGAGDGSCGRARFQKRSARVNVIQKMLPKLIQGCSCKAATSKTDDGEMRRYSLDLSDVSTRTSLIRRVRRRQARLVALAA